MLEWLGVGGDELAIQLQNELGSFYSPIALLDILGFRKLVSCKSPQFVAELVERVIGEVSEDSQFYNEQGVGFEWRLFSDTIIVWYDQDQKFAANPQSLILRFIAGIVRVALKYGLPLRGAISYGMVVKKSTKAPGHNQEILVGLPIIDAFEDQENACWAGATLTESMVEYLKSVEDFGPSLHFNEITRFVVPNKRGGFAERIVLCWWDPEFMSIDEVRNAFHIHFGPNLDERAAFKRENTIHFVQHCKASDIRPLRMAITFRGETHKLYGYPFDTEEKKKWKESKGR